MVYTCQFCGGWFPEDKLKEALANNDKIITCPYCNNVNEMNNVQTSHLAKGFDCLDSGDFYHAELAFTEALKNVHNVDGSYESSVLDAYLGRALAVQSVQVIYGDSEQIASPTTDPELNCFRCPETYLADSADYMRAMQIAKNIPFGFRDATVARLQSIADKIDGIKQVYDRKANLGEEYHLFIAYEDDGKDAQEGFAIANRIRDNMPSGIKKVYIPTPEQSSYAEREGSLLYALHNSKCMITVVDSDMDARLMNLYARYYYAMTNDDSDKSRALGFVRYMNKSPIHLPDHGISKHVFDFENKDDYCRFACESNNIFYSNTSGLNLSRTTVSREKSAEYESDDLVVNAEEKEGAPRFDGKICRFGSYPQHRVMDEQILSVFTAEGKPSMSSPNGWEIMFTSRTGQPYTWYKDKVIDGKKYRAVFFMKYREVFTSRQTDLMPSIQRMANYTPMRIYVFAFDDIEWNVFEKGTRTATMISSVGLESREYDNNCDFCADWECSSIRKWLNEDMINTAFTAEEREYLFDDLKGDKASLIESSAIVGSSNRSITRKLNTFNIVGSDYLKCIGGYCDRYLKNFWINSEIEDDGQAAAVQPHNVNTIVPQCIDDTSVAVLPVIRVKFASNKS